ncbi:unnamed protein product [Leptidea sinapis]|uniref:PID domain-containing protein n=1 Tax=Leptidea sinapis TaxID=189913 RepID=A0A5E4PT38_9NEOP|nr:unnamed protein product [Leptidea sinapis]
MSLILENLIFRKLFKFEENPRSDWRFFTMKDSNKFLQGATQYESDTNDSKIASSVRPRMFVIHRKSVRMSHALRRISYATCESARALFAFVAREPRSEPQVQYCHAFETDSPDQKINSVFQAKRV